MIIRNFKISEDGVVYSVGTDGDLDFICDSTMSIWDILTEILRESGIDYSIEEI